MVFRWTPSGTSLEKRGIRLDFLGVEVVFCWKSSVFRRTFCGTSLEIVGELPTKNHFQK